MYHADPNLIAAITSIESGGNSNATSPQGARGSMQIMPATFKQYAMAGESYDNDSDRRAAAIRKINDDFNHYGGDVAKTAAAYIGGRGAVRADGTIRNDVADSLGTTPSGYADRVMKRIGATPMQNTLSAPNWQSGDSGIPIDSPEAKALLAQSNAQRQGALSKVAAVQPITSQETTSEQPATGPLSAVATKAERPEPDIAAMLAKYVPEDDSSSKYLAMAAALGRPTGFGSFGEKMANVADALMEQKQNQQKLRAQYTPLIMQQVAAQQAREEQAAYRLEAQQQAMAAQRQAAIMAQQGRVDLATQAQEAAKERDEANRISREAIAADRLAVAGSAEKLAGKPPSGYAWGPTGADGNPTLIAVKGGPADLKQVGMLNADTQALTGATSSFDRLAIAANQMLTHPGLPGITGLRGAIPNVPGTAAADAQAKLDTLKSQVGFGVLQDMRNQSKTGGALGVVSDKELAMLQANLAALDKAQSLEQFKSSLEQIIDYTEKAKDRMREAYNLKHGDGNAKTSAAAPDDKAKPTAPAAPKTISWGDLK